MATGFSEKSCENCLNLKKYTEEGWIPLSYCRQCRCSKIEFDDRCNSPISEKQFPIFKLDRDQYTDYDVASNNSDDDDLKSLDSDECRTSWGFNTSNWGCKKSTKLDYTTWFGCWCVPEGRYCGGGGCWGTGCVMPYCADLVNRRQADDKMYKPRYELLNSQLPSISEHHHGGACHSKNMIRAMLEWFKEWQSKYEGIPVDYRLLSVNNSLTCEFIEAAGVHKCTAERDRFLWEGGVDENWDWDLLSKHKNITEDFILKHIDKPWNFRNLSKNPNITERIVGKLIDKPWSFRRLSKHKNISIPFVRKHSHKPWNFRRLVLYEHIN